MTRTPRVSRTTCKFVQIENVPGGRFMNQQSSDTPVKLCKNLERIQREPRATSVSFVPSKYPTVLPPPRILSSTNIFRSLKRPSSLQCRSHYTLPLRRRHVKIRMSRFVRCPVHPFDRFGILPYFVEKKSPVPKRNTRLPVPHPFT